MKNLKVFYGYDAYSAYVDKVSVTELTETPTLVFTSNSINMDMHVECKGWRTAVNRFKKQFSDVSENVSRWIDVISDGCEGGVFSERYRETPSDYYMYSVEEVGENLFYIYLNIAGWYISH